MLTLFMFFDHFIAVVLNVLKKLVYSAHDYPSTVNEQSWFNDPDYPSNLHKHWRTFWGYIFQQNIAPGLLK